MLPVVQALLVATIGQGRGPGGSPELDDGIQQLRPGLAAAERVETVAIARDAARVAAQDQRPQGRPVSSSLPDDVAARPRTARPGRRDRRPDVER